MATIMGIRAAAAVITPLAAAAVIAAVAAVITPVAAGAIMSHTVGLAAAVIMAAAADMSIAAVVEADIDGRRVLIAAVAEVIAAVKQRRSSRNGGGGHHGGGGGHHGGGRHSDIRLKHDIVLLGRLDNGLGFYRFSYNGSDKAYVGVMAQEVQAVKPEAVVRGRDGYLRVYYDELGLRTQ